ncbi:MAG: oligoendopeptidase family [Verrucomicrobiales bacterium]|nr:oligoendopeptidase family [Verrucomicrobiales bacterium]
MSLLPFKDLPPYRKRSFVSPESVLSSLDVILPLFDRLESQATAISSPAELEQWLLDCSEVSAAMDEESSRRYIAMSCHTDNPEAEKAYLEFVEKVEPELKPRQFKLAQIYLENSFRKDLPQQRYAIFDRSTALHVELYRPENIPLETEEAKIGQQYQKLAGSLTVQFRGEEKTLVQMGKFLEETDRSLRKEAWELVSTRRIQEAEKFEDLFEKLFIIREQIAKNAGFQNYRDYSFRARGRFDYTPEDCVAFQKAIETEVVPVLKELHEERKRQMKLESVRPWDLAVDPENRPPLRPFEQVEDMVSGSDRIFQQVDKDLAYQFQKMRQLQLLDLGNRKGKAPGGYQSTLAESRVPFIFMNAVGQQRDVETMLHEAGHAFHAFAAQEDDLYAYRSAPIEFCEVASMSMELLGNQYLEQFYPAPEAKRARRDHLEGIVEIFPWIATVDAFQHWIYSHPGHTRTQRTAAWIDLMDRFGGNVDWTGFEHIKAALWHRQLHIFLYPFYYIEYGIAQLGALQVWANSKKNPVDALNKYKQGLKLGGSRPLPELFEAAGCKFDFSSETVKPLLALLQKELALP